MTYVDLKAQFNELGYAILDLELGDIPDKVNKQIDQKIAEQNFKKNPDFYHYNESPRIVEAWKDIDEVKQLSQNPIVINFLKDLYGRYPLPFSTINFIYSTEQPLHSDYIHFGSIPELFLTGVWIALEDIHPDSGPLTIVPKSHNLEVVDLDILGVDVPKNNKQLKENYTIYESYIENLVEESGLERVPVHLKKGQCLIWHANLLHGGSPLKNPKLTRRSLVTHYHYSDCENYNPSFSSKKNNIIAERKIEVIN